MEGMSPNVQPLRQDSFKLSGNNITVILTERGIEWHGKSKSKQGSIEWADVLHVTPIPASCRKPQGPAVTLHYIAKPNDHWRTASVIFTASCEDGATSWVAKVNQLVLEKAINRPKRLMVIINPKSGGCKGVKVYETKVAPIFKLAGIVTDVTITEKAQHAVELLKKTDLSQYNGVVSVGGDGTLTECLVGLAAVSREAHSVDPDDDTLDLPAIGMRIGIIPAGTGQGMVEFATGTKSSETAALHIIYGGSFDLDLFTVHSGRRLIYTACLLSGYGMFGEMIRLSENNRQMGRLRYLYSGKAAVSPRKFKCDVHILKPGTDGSPPEWISRSGEYTGVYHFMADPTMTRIYQGAIHVYLEKRGGFLARVKYYTNLWKPGPMVFPPFVEHFEAVAFKITPYTGQGDQSANGAGAGTAELPYSYMNIDGECFDIDPAGILTKIHPKSIRMFGTFLANRALAEAEGASGSSK